MSNKYNHIPGSCHFLPFFSGDNCSLHYSYTDDHMYCLKSLHGKRSANHVFPQST